MSVDTLPELLENARKEHGDRVAVDDGDRSVTYIELDARANRFAHLLRTLAVAPGDRVGILSRKALEAVVAVYGVLKAGAVYVPLDRCAPLPRLTSIISDCGIRVLVIDSDELGRCGRLVEGTTPIETVIMLDARSPTGSEEFRNRTQMLFADVLDRHPISPPRVRREDSDLAYILYTSGSTGTPKGVMLSHRNALAFVEWATRYFEITPNDRLASHAPLHFDLSVFDLFAASRAGARVVLVPEEIVPLPAEVAAFIRRSEITVWYSVPSALTMLVQRGGLVPGDLRSLRSVLFAGEVFPTSQLRRLMSLLEHARFYNLYGPTETNVCTCYAVPALPAERIEPIPIGMPIFDVRLTVIDERGEPVAAGERGELCVVGPTVMLGYWEDPARTAEVLVNDPAGSSRLAYRTGDLVWQQADGQYQLIGRRDHQIKSRGYRIELGEVEAALHAQPAVVECAVVAVPDEIITNRIAAFVTVREPLSVSELLRFCAERLPKYMLPQIVTFVAALPNTSTGKVDREKLIATVASGGRKMNPKERLRQFILNELNWEGPAEQLTDDYLLIKRKAVDSLDTLRLVAFIESEFGVEVQDAEMVTEHFGTLAALAEFVEEKLNAVT